MRNDMSKVIVERPRHGNGWGRKGRAKDYEDLPSHEGIKSVRGGRSKHFNENLAPLKRYLEKQVGRPWSKVYSEISQCLRPGNTVQRHVRFHLKDFVAIDPRRDVKRSFLRSPDAPWWQPLYVDPKDGILKRTDRLPEVKARRRRQPKPDAPEIIHLRERLELRRLKGLWYELETATESLGKDIAGQEVMATRVRKRSLSHSELRRHRLSNDPET